MPYATISAHRQFVFKVDPYDISWTYNMRTQTTDTYGGRVVQILGVDLGNLSINTVCGKAGYPYLEEMKSFFREMGLWQQNEQKPATFLFPPKNYNLKFWGQRFSFDNAIDNVVYPVQISGMIQEDLAGTLKKSIMTAELSKLADGIGYVRNEYNDPEIGAENIAKYSELKAMGADPLTGSNLSQPVAGGAAQTVSIPNDKIAETVVNRALSQIGVTYAWGGGDANGPTKGIRDGGTADSYGDYNKIGFDCSGLAVYAYAGAGINVPHQTQAIWAAFPHITDRAQCVAGDLLEYSSNGRADGIHHVGIYMGGDQMVEAPNSGATVKISTGIWEGNRGQEFIGAVRPR